MNKEIIFTLRSPYRENMDVVGYRFGSGERSAAIVGSFRGNEIQQMYVCSQLVKILRRLEETGQIVKGKEIMVIPCVNYYSMNIGKRFWPMDNTDINRMFPGYDMGETTQRIADGVFARLQGYEYGIQLASFYQPGNFLGHVKMMETGFTDKELMKKFGLRYGIVREPRPYDTTTLNYNWQIWETKAFSVYSGSTDRIDENAARESIDAILRFLNGTGIITRKVRPGYLTSIIPESNVAQIHTETAGIFVSMTETGREAAENDVIGKIVDPFDGETLSLIRTRFSGIVFFEYDSPLINEHTVVFKIIRE